MKNNKSFIRSDNEKQDILKFIERFPKDATTWDKATEELPVVILKRCTPLLLKKTKFTLVHRTHFIGTIS